MMGRIDDMTHYIEGAVLQTRGSMDGLEPQIRTVLSDVDPNLTLLDVLPMREQVDANFDQQRAVANMTGLFGILALILAAVGLYGVTAYTVERRTSEIGVRMALGADRPGIVRLVLRGAFLQILIGLLIGIPASIGCAHLIAAQLYQVKGWDPSSSLPPSSLSASAPSSPALSPPSAPLPSIPSKLSAPNERGSGRHPPLAPFPARIPASVLRSDSV